MASSQVKNASLGSSFGCVLRDRNQRHSSEYDVVFQKNLKAQVKSAAISDENSQNRVDSWIGNKPKKKNKSRLGSPEKPRVRKSKRNDNLGGGASSLVQIWEARLNRSNAGNSPINGQSTESGFGLSVQEINVSAPESESENESKNLDLPVEIGSGNLNSVADIIRRLKLAGGGNGGAVDMPIVKTSPPCVSSSSSSVSEKSVLPVVTCSPRLRGRQAFSDLLMHLERDRNRELESLRERNAVSRFPQRGRLQVLKFTEYFSIVYTNYSQRYKVTKLFKFSC